MVELKEGMDVSKLRFRAEYINKNRKILAVYDNGDELYPFAVVVRDYGDIKHDCYTKNGFYYHSRKEHEGDIIEVEDANI